MRIPKIGIGAAGLVAVALLLPGGVRAQAGALGSASALGAPGENAHAGAPVFTESGLTLGQGAFAASAVAGFTSGTLAPETTEETGFDVFQLLASAFLGLSDDLTVGAILPIVNSVSVDGFDSESGIGDLTAYAKWGFAESSDGRTNFALIAQAALPTGEDGFGSEGLVLGGGLGLSRDLDGGSLHASAGVVVPTDDLDGDPFFTASGAGVLGLGDAVGVSAEASLSIGDETFLNAGPAVRFRASENLFIDAGLILSLVNTVDEFADVDYAIFAGINVGG